MLTEETQELFANCLVLLVEAAAHNSATDLLADKVAAARLDVVITKLKNPYAKDVPDLVLQVLLVEPDSAYAYTVWGLALAKEGRFDRSLMDFDTAIDLDEGFLLAVCGKVLLLSVTIKCQGLPEEVALLQRVRQGLRADSGQSGTAIGKRDTVRQYRRRAELRPLALPQSRSRAQRQQPEPGPVYPGQ
tara:strand:- start:845 stop:1411 length:567 start_codon:yes stop_codon:yes gene_type:complete